MTTNRYAILSAALIAGLFGASAQAATFSFSIDQTGGPDNARYLASLDVNVKNNTVTVTLTNNTPITYSAAELLTGVKFDGVETLAGLTPTTTASYITVTDNTSSGVSSASDPGSGDWVVSNQFSLGPTLNWMPKPDNGIIGPTTNGAYPVANNSVVFSSANDPHMPLIYNTLKLVFSKPANFPATITGATFYFGTTMETILPPPPPGGDVPEPASLGLLALGGLGLLGRRRR